MDYIRSIPALAPFLDGCNFTDIKTFESTNSMRVFIAAMLSHRPWWLKLFYGIRSIVVGLLGLSRQADIDLIPVPSAQDVSLTPGDLASFFIVRKAEAASYWIAETPEDKHLAAFFAVVLEPFDGNRKRFHVVTLVRYKHWTGPVYFNLIRPFHHLVVWQMGRAGAKEY